MHTHSYESLPVPEMHPGAELYVRDALEGFLYYLLDARWFTEPDHCEKKRRKANLRAVGRQITGREAFIRKNPNDVRLENALTELRDYERDIRELAKEVVRRAPQMAVSVSRVSRKDTKNRDLGAEPWYTGETDIAERLW